MRRSSLRKARPDRTQKGHVPAPVGGLNTVDVGFLMPELDCPVLYNMIGAENGLRSRLGSREWVTGLTGVADNTVRSILPFTGSLKDGTKDKLFACTSKGIWDVTSSTQAPTAPSGATLFGTQTGDAGYGISTIFVSFSGGHFLIFCDEVNGYFVYNETTGTWIKVVQASNTAWAASTVYAANAVVTNGGLTYKTAAGGTSAAAPATGPSGTGAAIVDNTVTWAYTPSVSGVDPATFAFCVAWKSRIWFVQKDTALAWYLPIGALFGTASSFNFGTQFRKGGDLRGLWRWTGDGGSGPDDRLVLISGGGDVVIYEGTDPASVNTFGIVGQWDVHGVPAGRRIATDHGGDLLILSTVGILPVSRLAVGNPVIDRSQYSTYKVGNLFNKLATTYRSLKGWALRVHPEDATLLVTTPVADGQATTQLAMSLQTPARGWGQYRDLPLLSMEGWGGLLYFGTADGRVCINTGYVDGVLLSNTSAFTAIDCSGITRFSNLGAGNQKQLVGIRPTVISEAGRVDQTVQARYRFDLTEATVPTTSTTSIGSNLWGVALWGVGLWGGAYATQQKLTGATGMGPDFAVAFRFAALSRTVLIGFDVEYLQGGAH